jgi:hypothetical protein
MVTPGRSPHRTIVKPTTVLVVIGLLGVPAFLTVAHPAAQSVHYPALGPPPTGCGNGPAPRMIPSLGQMAAGSAPVWALFLPAHGPLLVPMDAGIVPSSYGWPWKIGWVERRGYNLPVTIRAWSLSGGPVVWFKSERREGQNGVLPYLRLDPRHISFYPPAVDPKHPDRVLPNVAWKGYGSVMYIPRAGCYMLEASWPDGSWRVRFAAGGTDLATS